MGKSSKRILILGGSGFLGYALYKELNAFYDVYCTYKSANKKLKKNNRFIQWDLETELPSMLLEEIQPDYIISALRGGFYAQLEAHIILIDYVIRRNKKLLFLSSANVFDAFTNFPSYEYDKTFSYSKYGHFKIKIENALLRLPNECYSILRIPMIFGKNAPRLKEIKALYELKEPIEVFPNVVLNATSIQKFTQQTHFIINRKLNGIFHLGSNDLIHHNELIDKFCRRLRYKDPLFKQVYNSNNDRLIAVIPKDNKLPENYQINIEEVVDHSILL